MRQRILDMDVLTAARQRISAVFDSYSRIYVSFSAGKDSTVLLHLVGEEARRRGRIFGLLLIDLEAQYALTMQHAESMFRLYADVIEPYWLAVPLRLRNAVSMLEPRWTCWNQNAKALWVRHPPTLAITADTASTRLPFYQPTPEFEELVDQFHVWYGQGESAACFVGIRAQESLNRWRAVTSGRVARAHGWSWSTEKTGGANVYPIYDWRTEDLWTFHARTGLPHNTLYDRMHQAGLTPHQMRICQPYGDDQRKGLWLYHVLEPETWARVVARVSGANSGALYALEKGNILGRLKVTKPDHLSWREFCRLLLDSMPAPLAEHYRNKIAVWCKWWLDNRGVGIDDIPDCAEPDREAAATVPSWRRIAKVLLRNDYWCKGLHFSQTKSGSYQTYLNRMKDRRDRWRIDV